MKIKSFLLAAFLMVAFFASNVYGIPYPSQDPGKPMVFWSTETAGVFYYNDGVIPTRDTDYSVSLFQFEDEEDGPGDWNTIGTLQKHTGSDNKVCTFAMKDFNYQNGPESDVPAGHYCIVLGIGDTYIGESDQYDYPGRSSTTAQAQASPQPARTATIAGSTFTVKTVNVPVKLNVRSGAGVSHSILATFKDGDIVYVVETKGNWSKVLMWNGKYGWVYNRYLQ